MLKIRKQDCSKVLNLTTEVNCDAGIEELLKKQWLLTNNRGGYCCSTVVGCNTSRYHGLLVSPLRPPVERIMALANCLEMVITAGKLIRLSTFEFSDKFAPRGYSYLKRFRKDSGVHFDYESEMFKLTKSIYLVPGGDSVAIIYSFEQVSEPVELVIRPFVGLRDFHTLQKSYARIQFTQDEERLLIRHQVPESCLLHLKCPQATFEKDEQWWFDFVYREDREKRQEFKEDLWTPGFYKCRIERAGEIFFFGGLKPAEGADSAAPGYPGCDVGVLRSQLEQRNQDLVSRCPTNDANLQGLIQAAGQFISISDNEVGSKSSETARTTILAGFPWFVDWARDTFVSLQGLLLDTGMYEQARSVLLRWSRVADAGMIPNRFDNRSNTAYFNSVDASLWFIRAAFQYLKVTDDTRTFTEKLLPTIQSLVDAYHSGTMFQIGADKDGLITFGTQQGELTWMDAQYEGRACTARYGKVVEINSLWFNSLCMLSQFFRPQKPQIASRYQQMADKVKTAFCKVFWNEKNRYLNDCVFPDGTVDASLRPNQIFAVSLDFSPLDRRQQKSIVDIVHKELVTAYGLRTLSPRDKNYIQQYGGTQEQRECAYHQGMVWPWLMGAFVESYLKVNGSCPSSRKKAAGFIETLLKHFAEEGCIGQLSEAFDGEAPHQPRGCIAQAWSVAELIRAYKMIKG